MAVAPLVVSCRTGARRGPAERPPSARRLISDLPSRPAWSCPPPPRVHVNRLPPAAHRPRWCVGRCGAHGGLQWLRSFGIIVAVLAMPLQSAPSTRQVLHPPPACASCPQRSLTTGCTPCVAGGCLERQWKLLSMAAKRQHAAVSWQQAGARAVHPAATAGLRRWLGGPRSRLGRQQLGEPADPSRLAGPPGPTAEPGGLWSPSASSRVRV